MEEIISTKTKSNNISRLVLIKELPERGKYYRKLGLFKCDCGVECIKTISQVKNGYCLSCGCLGKEIVRNRLFKHGLSKRTEYHIWQHIIQRCCNSNCDAFKNYGGRGIKICDRWLESFENFYEDMGDRPNNDLTIHRKNNDGHYCKENCIWATEKEQANERRTNRKITFNGKTQTRTQWERELGFSRGLLSNRIDDLGWEIEKALKTPVRSCRKNKHRL